jgi:hypothetical protein
MSEKRRLKEKRDIEKKKNLFFFLFAAAASFIEFHREG